MEFIVNGQGYVFERVGPLLTIEGYVASRGYPRTLDEAKELAEIHQENLYRQWAARMGYDD